MPTLRTVDPWSILQVQLPQPADFPGFVRVWKRLYVFARPSSRARAEYVLAGVQNTPIMHGQRPALDGSGADQDDGQKQQESLFMRVRIPRESPRRSLDSAAADLPCVGELSYLATCDDV